LVLPGDVTFDDEARLQVEVAELGEGLGVEVLGEGGGHLGFQISDFRFQIERLNRKYEFRIHDPPLKIEFSDSIEKLKSGMLMRPSSACGQFEKPSISDWPKSAFEPHWSSNRLSPNGYMWE